MKSLFLDTSSSNVSVLIVEDDKVVASFCNYLENDIASKIFPIIDDLFSKLSFEIKDIDKVYVVNGPGSFTGVRIGVTIAKVLASSLNIPVCPISSLEYMASGANNRTLALIDARRGYVYAGSYDEGLNTILKDKYTLLSDIDLSLYDEIVSYDRFDFETKKPALDVIKIIKKYEDFSSDAHALKPEYLKLTEAEEKMSD